MSKSHRKRRRRNGRVTSNPTAATTLLRQNYQKYGSVGIVNLAAHFAGQASNGDDEEPRDGPRRILRGKAFVQLMAKERSKLGAGALAAAAEVWPEPEVRDLARDLLAQRRNQLSGMLRDLGETTVVGTWRLTNEYRDVSVLLFELAVVGRHLATLAVTTEENSRWIEVLLLNPPAVEAAEQFDLTTDQPGGPRRIFQQLEREDARFEAWILSGRRQREGEPAAGVVLGWVARLLDVDVEFPAIPSFNRTHDVDGELDFEDALHDFLWSEVGGRWGDECFDELVDHLRSFESSAQSLRWSPARVEYFLLFQMHGLEDGHAYALPALLRGWVAHCATVTRQRKPLLRAVRAEIDRCEPEFFVNAA